jgi:hypothetical protein
MKWRRVSRKEDSHLPSNYIQLFLLFKKLNKILLALSLGVLIYHCVQLGVKGLAFFWAFTRLLGLNILTTM